VLAALGVSIELTPRQAATALKTVGIAFLFAPKLHPAMQEVMPVRRELAVRTIFNILGPLTNPAGAERQVVGVYAPQLVELVGRVLLELGSKHALVVHGSDGLDEITTTGPTRVAEVQNGELRLYDLDPATLGVERAAPADLAGGSPQENAEMLLSIFRGTPGPLAEITVLNAGAALYVAGLADDLATGLAAAREALVSGQALAKLEDLRRFAS
jgi:anthranilate phosphoribosyltransferase